MLTFAMDCWLVGVALAILIDTGRQYKNNAEMYKHIALASGKLGFVLLAVSNFAVSFGVMWSMWD